MVLPWSMVWMAGGATMDAEVVPFQLTNYPPARYVTTLQDHFDPQNVQTWQQAFFVNDTFWKPGGDAPVFLCVGGEGPLYGDSVVDSVHCSNAAEWLHDKNALMFGLEHRYYGCHNMSACPVADFDKSDSYKFLSSRQAVEDVANFVKSMNRVWNLNSSNKWITWGGSYPGMMAGWSRLKHPELIHASVASSAPVLAKLDMSEYNDRVAHAYTVSNNGVGGSQLCHDAIKNGHERIGSMLQTSSGQAQLEARFELKKGVLSTHEGQVQFAGYGVAEFPAQGNDPTCSEPACNIKKICEIMTDNSHGDEVDRLLVVRNSQNFDGDSSTWYDHWDWQKCTEFGFFKPCEKNSSCFFVQGLSTLAGQTTMCQQWDIDVESIEESIESTNTHYGGLQPLGSDGTVGSCVMWPNGEVDPWAGLSVLESPSESQPVLYVNGASHHAWTHKSLPSDQESVVKSRHAIRKQVEMFLQQDCSSPHNVVV